MRLADRLERSRQRRAARALGQQAALGLVAPVELVEPELVDPKPQTADTTWSAAVACPRCGRPGHVEALDLPGGRGHLRCTDCAVAWDVDVERRDRTRH